MAEAAPAEKREVLYLKVPSQQCRAFEKVKNILSLLDGPMPVYIYFEDIKKLTVAPKGLWALDHPLLMPELKRILGEANVVKKLR